MTLLVVPGPDAKPWPTLGPEVCDFLEDRCVFGPGDLRGRPYVLDDEKRALIYRLYEVHPRGHAREGKRRFKRAALSLRKGTAKTELAAAIAFAELHAESPVRCDGFKKVGSEWIPVGRPVVDPYIPMVAYTEEQTEDLAYAALYVMCTLGPDADLFDAGLERIMRIGGDGKAAAMASAPDSRDGARTTFQHFDEPHRMTSARLIASHETMLQNIPKRPLADPWSLETSTTYTPGEGSVQQTTHEQAEKIAQGKASDPTFFFFHREAGPEHDISTAKGLRAAIRDASGPAIAKWPDFRGQVEAIASLYAQALARGNGPYFERVWLNRRVQSARQAFSPVLWKQLDRPTSPARRRDAITLGLDGSKWRDATALIATHFKTGYQWPVRIEERPDDAGDEWEIDAGLFDVAVDEMFSFYSVLRLYGDPAQGWDDNLARYASKYGHKRVAEWYTDSRSTRKHATACVAYAAALRGGLVPHSPDETFARHIGNARRRDTKMLDDEGQPLWVVEKERHDSPFKIDGSVAAVLSWAARQDAMHAGEGKQEENLVYY